jgi:NADH:ubiquinone oxidoreductase subunit C
VINKEKIEFMDLEEIREHLGSMEVWVNKAKAWWLETPNLDVEKMARLMVDIGSRLVTVTASRVPEGEFRIIYHWDLQGQLLNFVTLTHQATLPSIMSISPVADWIEREIHDYFAVDFAGRKLPTLVLSEKDPPGIFSWNFLWKGKEGGHA